MNGIQEVGSSTLLGSTINFSLRRGYRCKEARVLAPCYRAGAFCALQRKLGEVIDLATVKNVATEAADIELAKIRLLQQVDEVRLGVVVLEGETNEQTNDSHDIFYLVQEGSIDIHIKDESVSLGKGEGYVVMKKSPYKITSSTKSVVMVLQSGKEG